MKTTATLVFSLLFTFSIATAQKLEWVKTMGGTESDAGYSIAVDGLGNVYTTGWFQRTVDFDPNVGVFALNAKGSWDIFIQKLDARGSLVWAKAVGGIDGDQGYAIAVDGSMNVYTTGYFRGVVDFDPNAGISYLTAVESWDVFIQKLDANGSFLWAKSMGGIGGDIGYGIEVDDFGNVYSTGFFRDTVDFDPGPGVFNLYAAGIRDVFIQKLDSAGNFLWAKNIGGVSGDEGFSMTLGNSGSIYVTGLFSGMVDFDPNSGTSILSSQGGSDIFLLKLDSNGNFLWAKGMGEADDDIGYSIAVDKNENIYSTGYFSGIVDFDPGVDSTHLKAKGESDIFIQKLDPNGNFVWVKSMGGIKTDVGESISVDDNSNVYTTGRFIGTVDFDPGLDSSFLAAKGQRDIFIQKLDSSGNFIWAKNLGGSDAVGTSLTVNSEMNIYTVGYFFGMVDFDPDTSSFYLTALGSRDIFVHKLNQNGNVAIDPLRSPAITLFPNPATGLLQIDLPPGVQQAQVQVVGMTGRIVHQDHLTTAQTSLDLKHLAAGVYHLDMILSSGERYVGKVVLAK